MKIGDKFIAERFETKGDGVYFQNEMSDYLGKTCEVIEWNMPHYLNQYVRVKFSDGGNFSWLKSALKPIKSNGFYVGQKVYSHIFPTDDCSGVVSTIYDSDDVYDVEVIINSKKFAFSKDGRYSEVGGICLFDEPIERPRSKFEYGELIWASNGDDLWTLAFFDKKDTNGYGCFTHKDSDGNLMQRYTFDFIKKYE